MANKKPTVRDMKPSKDAKGGGAGRQGAGRQGAGRQGGQHQGGLYQGGSKNSKQKLGHGSGGHN